MPEDEDVRAALAASQADPAKVTVLRDLGISEELARKALEVCSNNADRAAEWAITRDVSDVEGIQRSCAALLVLEGKIAELEERGSGIDGVDLYVLLSAANISEDLEDLDATDGDGDPALHSAIRAEIQRCKTIEDRLKTLRDGPHRVVQSRQNGVVFGSEQVPPPVRASRNTAQNCVICMDAEAEFAVVPCGHQCLCHKCQSTRPLTCPVCRCNVQQMLRIFLAAVD